MESRLVTKLGQEKDRLQKVTSQDIVILHRFDKCCDSLDSVFISAHYSLIKYWCLLHSYKQMTQSVIIVSQHWYLLHYITGVIL